VQAFGGSDGSGVTDAQADSANDIVSFSSRGPCSDGRHKPEITAPIIGATKPQHLQDAVAALDVKLTEDEVKALEAPYAPHPVVGISW